MLSGPTVAYPNQSPLEMVKAHALKNPRATAVIREDGELVPYSALDTSTLEALVRTADAGLAQKYEFPKTPPKGLDAPAFISRSSGTIGPVKQVLRTYRNIISRLAWDLPKEGEVQLVFPHGIPRLVACMISGRPSVVIQDDKPERLEAILNSPATHISLWPSMVEHLVRRALKMPRVQEVLAIGNPLSEEVALLFHQLYPSVKLVNGYGSSEAGYCMKDWLPAANVAVWIADQEGVELKPGTMGNLVIEGPTVGAGYLDPSLEGFKKAPDGKMRFFSRDRAIETGGKIEFIGRSS